MKKSFKEMAELVDDLAFRLMNDICKHADFNLRLKKYNDEQLSNMLFILVNQERYEHAVIVRNEMIERNINTSEISEYEKYNNIIKEHLKKNI